MESKLAARPIADVAKRARILGDPLRGAIVFHRPGLSCVQCHAIGNLGPSKEQQLGPDLALLGERATHEHIAESILKPSGVIHPDFRSEKLLLGSGKSIAGILRSEADGHLVVVVPGEEQPRRIPLDDVDVRSDGPSMMPAGLINQLDHESEFFDLVSFVIAIGKAGPDRAVTVVPDPEILVPLPLPEYENDLDHRGLISDWDESAWEEGESLYNRLCINCHGTKKRPGSLPNALRFARGKFRNGADPWSMYKTITHGYRMMLPQRQLTPEEKYNVIHYIRESYLRENNPEQYFPVDDIYLASLPQGASRGPESQEEEPWRDMDYGPFLINTYEMVPPKMKPRPEITDAEREGAEREGLPPQKNSPANANFAYKGIAIRLDAGPGGVSDGSHWIAFDHDTMRIAAAWSGEGFIDWRGILLDGTHDIAPRSVGRQVFANPPGPGWAHPTTGAWDDPRLRGRDGNLYGPLPRDWAHYRGLYKHGNRVVISYTVGTAPILESHRLETRSDSSEDNSAATWVRILNVGKSPHDLALRAAPEGSATVAVTRNESLKLDVEQGYTVLRIPAAATPVNFELRITSNDGLATDDNSADSQPENLQVLTEGGPSAWPQRPATIPEIGDSDGPFAADTFVRPIPNPWDSRLRLAGLDFLPDGKSLVTCGCDGDVWIVEGIDNVGEKITWRRIASGLFQPLGVKIIEGKIYIGCRDQIVILNDLNGDGETDFYENFNNDHQVTSHFHEFAMGLQTDRDGNLYYAKSARHARDSLVPQHGTLLRIPHDGSETTILANGFRAANGVCVNPDGSFFVTDQEGHWMPMNRINRVVEGGFYGNMYSYGAPDDTSDDAMLQPLCWVDKQLDRSPAELVWIDSDAWGPLNGRLLSLSYGVGKVFLVPHEQVGDRWQGGQCRLPLREFPTGVIRARFHPTNGHMYLCGMQAWATNQTAATGGLYRIRYTGRPFRLPVEVNALKTGIRITFSEPLDRSIAVDPEDFVIDVWTLRRTAGYGSDRYDKGSLAVKSASTSSDGRTVTLEIPDIKPTQCMQIAYTLKDEQGVAFSGVIQNTIHRLR
ncbi:c-type cytochrome [Pirellulales bacterium]|nr:c-type cytochrome [Pirellulales bacterium]